MTGERADKPCPMCGGSMTSGRATIPYVLDNDSVIVVKNVPAEICGDCHEAFTAGKVTDQVLVLLNQLKSLHSEVSVVNYTEFEVV